MPSSSRPTSTAPCCTPTARHRAHPRGACTAVEDLGVTVVFVTGAPDPLDARAVAARRATTGWRSAPTAASCTTSRPAPCAASRPIPVDVGLARRRPDARGRARARRSRWRRPPASARSPTFMERYPLPPDIEVGPLDEIFDGATVKLLARHEERGPRGVLGSGRGGRWVTWSPPPGPRRGRWSRSARPTSPRPRRSRCCASELGVAARRRRRLRGHAQRPGDARVGRHVVRDGQRAPERARRSPTAGRPPTRTTGSPRCSRSCSASDVAPDEPLERALARRSGRPEPGSGPRVPRVPVAVVASLRTWVGAARGGPRRTSARRPAG